MKLFGGINEVAQMDELGIPESKKEIYEKSKSIPLENYRDGDIQLSNGYLNENIVQQNKITQHHFILDHLEITNEIEFRSDLEYQHTCDIKQGFLLKLLNPQDKHGDIQDDADKYIGDAVFVALNTRTLTVYGDENQREEELENLVTLDDYENAYYDDKLEKSAQIYCFVLEQIHRDENKQNLKLCSDVKKRAWQWMEAVNEFKKCASEYDNNEKLKNVGVIQKGLIDQNRKKLEEARIKAYTDLDEKLKTEQAAIAQESQEVQNEEEDMIQRQLNELQGYLRYGSQKEQMDTRLVDQQIDIIEQKIKNVLNQKDCLDNEIEKQELVEKSETEIEIEKEIRDKMYGALIKVADNIHKKKDEERKNIVKIKQKELEEKKQVLTSHGSELLLRLMLQYKERTAYKCYSDELLQQNNKAHRNKVCKIAYLSSVTGVTADEVLKYDKCLKDDYFCAMCCTGFVNKEHNLKLHNCVKQCVRKLHVGQTSSKIQNDGKESSNDKDHKQLRDGQWLYVDYPPEPLSEHLEISTLTKNNEYDPYFGNDKDFQPDVIINPYSPIQPYD